MESRGEACDLLRAVQQHVFLRLQLAIKLEKTNTFITKFNHLMNLINLLLLSEIYPCFGAKAAKETLSNVNQQPKTKLP